MVFFQTIYFFYTACCYTRRLRLDYTLCVIYDQLLFPWEAPQRSPGTMGLRSSKSVTGQFEAYRLASFSTMRSSRKHSQMPVTNAPRSRQLDVVVFMRPAAPGCRNRRRRLSAGALRFHRAGRSPLSPPAYVWSVGSFALPAMPRAGRLFRGPQFHQLASCLCSQYPQHHASCRGK